MSDTQVVIGQDRAPWSQVGKRCIWIQHSFDGVSLSSSTDANHGGELSLLNRSTCLDRSAEEVKVLSAQEFEVLIDLSVFQSQVAS